MWKYKKKGKAINDSVNSLFKWKSPTETESRTNDTGTL